MQRTIFITRWRARRGVEFENKQEGSLADDFYNSLMRMAYGKKMRIGIGYDAHILADCRDLIIGGEKIPFEKGLLGHSDADVLIHAIMDALLGAAGLRDIGCHFPDTEAQFKGISSILLLEKVCVLLESAGYTVNNIDAVVVAQRPKLSAFFPSMKRNIAGVLNIPENAVNIKATTEEGMGFTGAGQGISAHAVCLLLEKA